MNIMICDDDSYIHEEIRKNLKGFFTDTDKPVIVDCYSGKEAMDYYKTAQKTDIVFLDIEIGETNGIQVAQNIKGLQSDAIIIFVSSHKNYVFEAFKCEALHFIVKPINKNEFDDVFNRALNKHRLLNNYLPVKWNHTRSNIKIDSIYYVEGFRRKLIIHTEKDAYEHTGKLCEAYKELAAHGFIYVHQSFIVNMHYIRSFYADSVELQNGESVMVSVRKRANALKIYDKYLQKWKW